MEYQKIKFNLEKLPRWAVVMLEEMEMPLELDPKKMTDDQIENLNIFTAITNLVDSGLVKVCFEENGKTIIKITDKGTRQVKEGRPPFQPHN